MTSASELFCNRRSRFGRHSDPFDIGSDFGSTPSVDRSNRRHRQSTILQHHSSNTRRDRIDSDGCDLLRRAPHHPRQPPIHRSSHPPQDRESTRLEHGSHQFTSGNVPHSANPSNGSDRQRFSENERLPGSVLLARERLMLRLSGATFSGIRRSNRISSSSNPNNYAINEVDLSPSLMDRSTEWPTIASFPSQQITKKPPGLSQEALNCLQMEVFCATEKGNEEDLSRVLRECSICLDSFLEGDELICLPCGHMYHFCCLDPWVRTCGDCPYCRRGILVTTHDGVSENPEC